MKTREVGVIEQEPNHSLKGRKKTRNAITDELKQAARPVKPSKESHSASDRRKAKRAALLESRI